MTAKRKKSAVQYSFSSGWGDTLDLGPQGIEMLGDPNVSTIFKRANDCSPLQEGVQSDEHGDY